MSEVGKDEWRRQLLAARRRVPDEVRRAESEQICDHLAGTLAGGTVVAAYLPVGTEPGTPEMLDVLLRICREVLLPITRIGPAGEHLPLSWGRYQPGRLAAGRFGLQEPTGPRLPPSALSGADAVLVPALAVDRRGVRLGRGGGFYDRSLPFCGDHARLIAVVRDDEVVDALPSDPHDVRMTHALTPAGLIGLG